MSNILNVILKEELSIKKLSQILKLSERQVRYHIKKLNRKGIVHYSAFIDYSKFYPIEFLIMFSDFNSRKKIKKTLYNKFKGKLVDFGIFDPNFNFAIREMAFTVGACPCYIHGFALSHRDILRFLDIMRNTSEFKILYSRKNEKGLKLDNIVRKIFFELIKDSNRSIRDISRACKIKEHRMWYMLYKLRKEGVIKKKARIKLDMMEYAILGKSKRVQDEWIREIIKFDKTMFIKGYASSLHRIFHLADELSSAEVIFITEKPVENFILEDEYL